LRRFMLRILEVTPCAALTEALLQRQILRGILRMDRAKMNHFAQK